MSYTVEISYDEADKMIIQGLKECIRDYLVDPWSMYHDYKKTRKQIKSFLRVLNHYLTESEFQSFKATLDYSNFPSK